MYQFKFKFSETIYFPTSQKFLTLRYRKNKNKKGNIEKMKITLDQNTDTHTET